MTALEYEQYIERLYTLSLDFAVAVSDGQKHYGNFPTLEAADAVAHQRKDAEVIAFLNAARNLFSARTPLIARKYRARTTGRVTR